MVDDPVHLHAGERRTLRHDLTAESAAVDLTVDPDEITWSLELADGSLLTKTTVDAVSAVDADTVDVNLVEADTEGLGGGVYYAELWMTIGTADHLLSDYRVRVTSVVARP